jgi:MFS family permease
MKWRAALNVTIAAVIMVATLPGRTQGLGLITEPMLRDLQLDRVTYAHINLWATLLGAAACLPFGRFLARFGLCWTTAATTMLLSVVVWQMSSLAGSVFALFLLVLATRALGQSALSVASITVVGKSFDRGVGLAMGMYSMLLSLLFAGAFSAVGGMVRENGWRIAWSSIAVALAVLVTPLVVLFLRDRMGATATSSEPAGACAEGFSLRQALRTPAFWIFGGATSMYGLVSSGLGLFNEAVLAERGFTQANYHQVLSGTALIALIGQFGCGFLSLRWSMRQLLAIALFLYGLALAIVPLLTTVAQLWVFAAIAGISGGMITVIFFAIWREAYGMQHLGGIQGAAQMLTVFASAIGPLLFAKSAELTGSYMPILWLLAVVAGLLSFTALRVSWPVYKVKKVSYDYVG